MHSKCPNHHRKRPLGAEGLNVDWSIVLNHNLEITKMGCENVNWINSGVFMIMAIYLRFQNKKEFPTVRETECILK
jgi:hypothetical protein